MHTVCPINPVWAVETLRKEFLCVSMVVIADVSQYVPRTLHKSKGNATHRRHFIHLLEQLLDSQILLFILALKLITSALKFVIFALNSPLPAGNRLSASLLVRSQWLRR